jgi:hypothetical protein
MVIILGNSSLGSLRVGSEFEGAVGELLHRLGFKVIDENVEIQCKRKEHSPSKQHEIDLICSFEKSIFVQPWCSTKHILVECKNSLTPFEAEEIAKKQVKNIECFRDNGYKIDGAIIITNVNMKTSIEKIFENVFLWELKRLFLYSFKVYTVADIKSAYEELPKKFSYKKRITKRASDFQGLTAIWGAVEISQKNRKSKYEHNFECFYDYSNSRFNEEMLSNSIQQIKKIVIEKEMQPAKVFIQIHSIGGFTRNLRANFEKIAKEFSDKEISIFTDSHYLFDYSIAPWQPLLGMVYE